MESSCGRARGRRPATRPARAAYGLALATLLAALPVSAAQITEETIWVPVEVQAPGGPAVRQAIAVTIVRAAGTRKRPFLLLLHGRGADASERLAMGLQTYPANSRYFASRGFVVLVPTRVGYGLSRGPDVEYTGDCGFKRFADGVAAAVSEARQVLRYAERLRYVDSDRGIVIGESFGGLAAIAIAASDIRGVVGAVNIAGGDGGDPRRRLDAPCRPDQLRETFARYGTANRLPTLWMYSRNDRLWGPVYPQQWYAAFTEAGGRGRFVDLPADKNNGHFIFNRNPPAWQSAIERFVAELRLTDPSG
jgi:dienelactone hydrolase